MTIAGQLFEKAQTYLHGTLELEELDRWMAGNASQLAELTERNPMAHLVGLIRVTLAEIDDGVAREADLLSRLANYFHSYEEQFDIEASSTGEAVQVLSSSSVEVGNPQIAEHIAP